LSLTLLFRLRLARSLSHELPLPTLLPLLLQSV
jgi:hypothetical protein